MNPTSVELIDQERQRQQDLWGGQHAWGEGDCSSPTLDPLVKLAVLVEEVGEVSKAILEGADPRAELVQVAAVTVAWLETPRMAELDGQLGLI